MRNWVTFLMTLLVSAGSYANANQADVKFEAGYRKDDLSFTVQVPDCDPFFKNRSRFEDVEIFQLGVRGQTTLGCNFYLRGAFSWGWILDGDYKEKTETFARPYFFEGDEICFNERHRNVLDGRFVLDFDIALGYPFYFCDCSMYLAPVVGYGFNEQNLFIEDSEHVEFTSAFTSSLFIPVSESSCCNNDDKLINRWYGPFIGVDFAYRPCNECWSIWGELEYHYARYNAKRHDFAGFSLFNEFNRTLRNAHGWVFAAGADYTWNSCWTVGLDVKVQNWGASRRHRHCHESTFGYFFGENSCDDGHFKTKVDWRSFAINLVLGRCF